MMNTRRINLSVRTIDFAGLAVCLTLTAAVFFFGVRPRMNREARRRAQQVRLVHHRHGARQAEAKLAASRERVRRVERLAAKQSVRLTPVDQLNRKLTRMTDVASRSHVEIDQIEPQAVREQPPFTTVPIRLTGRGGYADAARFLHRLHEGVPDAAVAGFDLRAKSTRRPSAAALRFDLRWRAFNPATADRSASTGPQRKDGPALR